MLKSYLKRVLSLVKTPEMFRPDTITYLGNEAADADSIVSSICYAYLKQSQQSSSTSDLDNLLHIPITPIERNELVLRQDVNILLQRVGLTFDDLTCINEVPFSNLLLNDKLKLTLLDHNSLSSRTSQYITSKVGRPISYEINGILDHHVDLENHPECTGASRVIEFDSSLQKALVGSTCTLIVERYLAVNPTLLDDTAATLLMGVICLDTQNMDPVIDKGTARDADAIAAIEPISSVNRTELFDTLLDAKMDIAFWRSLSAVDAMRLDFKAFTIDTDTSTGKERTYAISSVLLPIVELLEKPDIESVLDKYLRQEQHDCLLAMAFIDPSDPHRQLLVCTLDRDRAEKLDRYLLSLTEEPNPLNLIPCELIAEQASICDTMREKGYYINIYDQGNVRVSRKQMAPIILSFYQQ